MSVRHGEENKSWFRSDRFYHTNEGWWFQTRENTEQGPFSSHHDAEAELSLYIRQINVYETMFEKETLITHLQKSTS